MTKLLKDFLAAGLTILLMAGLAGITPLPAFSQNLVPNHSFENRTGCPEPSDHFPLQYLSHWQSPPWQDSAGYTITHTPDFFHQCAKSKFHVPRNFMGTQEAHHGKGYAGLLLFKVQSREYLQIKLKEPLKAGKAYYLKVNLSLADRAIRGIKSFGALLSKDSAYYGINDEHTALKPLNGSPDDFFDEKRGWQPIVACFKADGGEQYLTLGNFKKDKRTANTWVKKQNEKRERIKKGYYYLDDVAVLPCAAIEDCPCSFLADQDLQGKLDSIAKSGAKTTRLQLVNIYFETDKAKILEASHGMLYQLSTFLKENPDFQVVIEGHTDDRGSKEYNQQLAEERAKSVIAFLTADGVARERFSYKAYGASKPIAGNETPRGRRLNRRVEFILKQKP